LGHAYHLVPSGKTGVEAFAVIHEAMKKMGMVAIDRPTRAATARLTFVGR